MDRPDNPGKSLSDEVTRLGQELEQARVALEDAHAEVGSLVGERDRLRLSVETLERARAEAAAGAAQLRQHAAGTAALITKVLRQEADPDHDLRAALEEASVLSEELQAANEELQSANEALDRRVAERTEELGRANAELERMNDELQRRVETETAARAKAQADLFQMQKLEAIGQLTGGIAHDFNNLLMVITNGLQVLGQSDNARPRERALRRTQEAAWRAAELTRRLLAFARRQALHPERVDLLQQIDGLRELLGQGLREDIELRTDIPTDIWPLEADIGALELALLNLTVNARDAMPKGGTLTIAAHNTPVGPDEAGQRAVAVGDYVLIAVVDTGVGMAPEIVEKIFEPFFTTKGSGRGTGLGLPQVYGFAQQSGGTAWVDSRVGAGTAVQLLLPRSRREVEQDTQRQLSISPAATAGPLRVLVVEDEPSVAAVVMDMLGELGHTARSVDTVAAALAHLADGESTDLVLSDVLLPGGESGLDLARELRRRHVDVPIILTSGYGGAMTQRLGAMNLPFLRKPYQLDTLSQAIGTAMAVPSEEALDR
jgi:signal transduction histidine kinase/ActR/RegA family two-component response regulator